MKRRVCETCLYFEPAGFAKNGWCHHPGRRSNTDVRLVVRANELACRNGWDADLWVSNAAEPANVAGELADPIGARAAAEVRPAAPSDLITSIIAAKTENASIPEESNRPARSSPTVQEDVIVRQTPVLHWTAHTNEPASALVHNPRAAILRARDQFRARRRNERRLSDRYLSSPLIASSDPNLELDLELEIDDESLAVQPEAGPGPVVAPAPPIAPVTREEMDRPFPVITSFPEDEVRFETVPHVDEPNLDPTFVEFDEIDSQPLADEFDAVAYELEPQSSQQASEEDWRLYGEEPDLDEFFPTTRRRESTVERYLRRRKERKLWKPEEDEREMLPMHEDSTGPELELGPMYPEVNGPAIQQGASLLSLSDTPAPSSSDFLEQPLELPQFDYQPISHAPDAIREQEPAVVDDFGTEPLFAPTSGLAAQPHPQGGLQTSPASSISAVPNEDWMLDASYELRRSVDPMVRVRTSFADNLPRSCRTCRDFRPAENGDRGWCNNNWAFYHRRMVDADELACETSFGSFWIASDIYWRKDADISRHGQQTPRLDHWLAGMNIQEGESNRRRSQ